MQSRIQDHDKIAEVVQLYIDGASNGDASKLRLAFHPDARMFGGPLNMTMEPFFVISAKHPLNRGGRYSGRLTAISQVGDAAVATVTEEGCWGTASFVDFLSMVRTDGQWRIVNKSFAHTGGDIPALD